MNFFQIIKQDLRFYRRANLVTLLLAAVCCAVLTGAMLVGDSVQHTLRNMAQMRLGEKTQWSMTTGDRFFRQKLAEELEGKTDSLLVVPVLALKGEYLLRIQSPSELSNDMIFTTESAASRAWSIEIDGVLQDGAMGRFGLQASQELPLNVFVPIQWLAERVGIAGKANMLLVGIDGKDHPTHQELSAALKEVISPEDLGLQIHRVEMEDVFELRTPRIFLDGPVAEVALKTGQGVYGVFTYFVNEIRSGERSVPYSTVSAAGQGLLADLKADQIIINEWPLPAARG